MSLRTKILCLLLALAVLPLVGLRLRGQQVIEDVGRTLADISGKMLLEKAMALTLVQVQGQAALLRREGELLEQTIRLQALEVEKALPQPGLEGLEKAHQAAARGLGDIVASQATALLDGRTFPPKDFDPRLPSWFGQLKDATGPVWSLPRPEPDKGRIPLTVAYPVRDREGRFAGVTALMAALDLKNRRNGLSVLSPMVSVYLVHPEKLGSRGEGLLVLGRNEARRPPAEGKAPPAKPEDKRQNDNIGAHSASMEDKRIPADEAATSRPAAQTGVPAGVQSDNEQKPAQFQHGQAVSPPPAAQGQNAVGSTPAKAASDWFRLDSPQDQARLLAALKSHEPGRFEAMFRKRAHLVAYAPLDVHDVALVYVLPMEEITAEAQAARYFIDQTVSDQLRATGYLAGLALAAVTLVAWLVARGLSGPILQLDRAARRVAGGDLDVKVHPAGGGEIESLGRAFNLMVPELREKVRLSQAMVLARQVQHGLLPSRLPQPPGLDVAGTSRPCDETGGDYFDAVENARALQGVTALVVGDVSGHGVDAALYMTTARAYLRLRAQQPGDPARVVGDVNRFLTRDTHGSGRFMTLFYLEVDDSGLRYVRAGHDPALVYDPQADTFEELTGQGPPLGIGADFTYECVSRPALAPGQVLLVVSDGLWEARNPAGEMFGKDRVREALRLHAHLSARALVDALLGAQAVFREGRPARDDVTLLAVKAVDGEEKEEGKEEEEE